MEYQLMQEGWEVVKAMLPKDWEQSAREQGALKRARGIKDAEVLLRLILLHTAGGLSLKQAVMRAEQLGLARISSVALYKRLRVAEPWLRYLGAQMVGEMAKSLDQVGDSQRKWRLLDGTDIQESGPTGSKWRVHYSLQLPDLACDFFSLTDTSQAESLRRLPVRKGEVIMADRAYGNRAGVAHIVDGGADVVVRISPQLLPLLEEGGKAMDVLARLRSLQGHACAEWDVVFEANRKRYSARLCAVRKSALNTQRAQKKALRKCRCNGREIKPQTLELAGYIVVLTTLPKTAYPTSGILDLYRCRWQVELAFKRLKSLLALGHVPKTDPDSCRGWLQGKLLAALLIDRILRQGRFFSPWGFHL
jgi:hypothetical protein